MEYLTSWKEIARYLHAGVRTVQRYESENGFPVHRVTGNLRGSVRATTTEIDAWMNTVSVRPNAQLRAHEVRTKQQATLNLGIRRMVKLRERAESLKQAHLFSRSQLSETIATILHQFCVRPYEG